MKFSGHKLACTAIANSNEDEYIVTGSEDCKIKLWDQRINKNSLTFRSHVGKINHLRISPDSKWVASGSDDGSLRIWDIVADKEFVNFIVP